MRNGTSAPKPGESTWLWLLKIVSGVLVITLLFVHLTVNHFVAAKGLMTYQDVVNYLSNPWIAFMEMTFLVTVVVHSLIGTRSIILDLNPSQSALRAINWLFGLVGVASVIYGVWLIQTIVSHGAG